METKIEIDGKFYSFEELSNEQKDQYREDFADAEELNSQFVLSKPKPAFGKRVRGYVLFVVTIAVTGLAFLSFYSDVNTTVEINAIWISGWVATTVVVLVLTSLPYIKGEVKIPFEGGRLKKIGMSLAAVLGLSLISAFAFFSGFPIVLHHLTAKDGELAVTVVSKDDTYDKRACRPRLIVQEFTWFASDHVCPGEEAYKQIEVGSRITLSGKVSKYGIEASRIR